MKKYLPIFFSIVLLFLLQKQIFLDSYNVTGTVTPTANDFPLSISASPIQDSYHQDEAIKYTLTYGTTMGGPIQNYTIVASWNNDTPPTTVWTNVVNFVPGSASNAYGNTPAVVDLLHQQLTWNIPQIVGPISNQTVSFELVGNNNYTQPIPVHFTIYGNIKTPYLSTTPVNMLQTYEYDPTYIVRFPSPTQIPVPPLPNSFKTITIDTLSDTKATIGVTTQYPTTIRIYYSSNSKALTQKVDDNALQTNHEVSLTNLTPNTTYYFQVFANDEKGANMHTEFYAFKTTAKNSTPPITFGSLIVTANNDVLYSGNINKNTHPTIILPIITNYETTFDMQHQNPLSFTTVVEKSDTQQRTFPIFERDNNQFSGTLQTSAATETEHLFARVGDANGNIIEQPLTDIKVIPPLRVIDKQTQNPVEHAQIELFVWHNNTFSKLELNNLQNPTYTDPSGVAHIILPKGTYKAEISAQGYDSKEIIFSLENDGYPKIELKKQPTSIASWLWYQSDTLHDTFQSAQEYLFSLAPSRRLFELLIIIILTSFVLLSFVLFYLKTHIHFKSLPLFIAFHFLLKKHQQVIYGKIVNAKGIPLSHVGIHLLNKHGVVLESAFSNKNGSFVLKRPKELAALTCIKEGFVPETVAIMDEKPLQITIGQQATVKRLATHTVAIVEFIAGMFFEIILLFSLLLEVLFIETFGFTVVAPFLFLSLVNVVLGIIFLKDRAKH